MQTPTNNIGLAFLFKKFVLIGEEYQKEEVSLILFINFASISAQNLPISSPRNWKKAMIMKT